MENYEVLFRLLFAAVCGGIIGYQRERAEKPAGFRTHVLVCLGSSLLMIVSFYPFIGKPYADPSRIAAGAITGIGFLGAGAIISQGGVVKGLTTAASIWTVAAVGLAAGAGLYFPTIVSTLLILAILSIFKEMEIRVRGYHILTMVIQDQPGQLGKIGSYLGETGVNIKHVDLQCDDEKKICNVRMAIEVPFGVHPNKIVESLSKLEGVSRVSWEEQ